MRPIALHYGTEETVTLLLEPLSPPAEPLRQGDEVALRRDLHGDLVLRSDGGPRPAEPADPIQRHRLESLLASAMPRVCVVLDVFGSGPLTVVVELRAFAHHVRLEDLLTFTIDDDLAGAIDAAQLIEEFVLPAAAGAGARVIISSPTRAMSSRPRSSYTASGTTLWFESARACSSRTGSRRRATAWTSS